ncbi:methyltransferase [Clostridia bacterium]|nr:methyltransferase [Clostridia bacterium]
MLEMNRLYNMDCMEGMRELPDKFFDLAVVDVPYGIGEDGSKNKERSKLAVAKNYKAFHGNDLQPPECEYFTELMRVSKNQIIWGANHFISRIPVDSHCWIVWDKENGETDFADCELAWTSFHTAVRRFKYRWHGMLQEDMKNKEIRIHPTQKPIALYSWILSKYAKRGDKILDTHAGSASSLIACYRAGLDFIGFEIDTEYYTAANMRLTVEMEQIRINFDELQEEQEEYTQSSIFEGGG